MPEGVEGSDALQIQTGREFRTIPENDMSIDVLRSIESGYPKPPFDSWEFRGTRSGW